VVERRQPSHHIGPSPVLGTDCREQGCHGLTHRDCLGQPLDLLECWEIVDAMDESLKFVYTQLKTHMQASKAYEAGRWLRSWRR